MCIRDRVISYLKVRGSYTEVGAPVSRSGLTPGTVTTVSYTHLFL